MSKITKIKKFSLVALLILTVIFGAGVGSSQAALTFDATSVTGSTTASLVSTTTNAVSVDSGTTGAVNLGTGASAKTITVGNAASTEAEINALLVDINAGATGITIDAAGASNLTTSSGALTITSAAAATWSTAAGALTITGTGGLNLDSATTTAVNLGTAAAAKTITVGNAASTELELNAILVDINGAATGVTIDALDAGNVSIGTSTDTASDTSAINIGTSATARTITVGNAASTILDLNAISVDIDGAATGVTIDALDAGNVSIGTSTDTASDGAAVNIGTGGTRTVTIGSATGTVNVTAADPSFINLSAVLHNDAAAQGLRLPNVGAAPTDITGTSEGYIAWDETNNLLLVNSGTAWDSVFNNTASDNTFTGANTFAPTTITKALTIGKVDQTGTITLGLSTAGQTINVGSANVATGNTQNINIGNGDTVGTNNVSIAGGATANGGADVVNIGTGAPVGTGSKTIHIGDGNTAAGTGVNAVTIGSNSNLANTTAIRGGNGATAITLTPEATAGQIVIGAAAGQGAISIGTSSAAQTINIGVGAAAKTINIATTNTSGAITIGSATQTGATTINGGSTTNAVVVNANVGAVATEAHGLDVVSVGELSSGDNLVGVNSVLTPTGTAGTWASAVYGKVVQGTDKRVNGYISGGEFEVADTNAAPSEVHTLVLDGNSTAFDANSSYIWGQTFGGADMPNLLKLTGLASGTGNMWYGPTLRMKIGDSSVASRYLIMSETENKLDLGDGSGGIDIGTATTGINFTGTNSSAITLSGMTPGAAAGPLILAGTSASPISTATADTKFVQMYTKSTATGAGSDTRGIYDRLYLAGATTGGGEALRAYTTIDDAVVGTAHGAHISLDFDSTANSAQLTGLGVAGRNTLHIPNDAAWTSGTLAAVQAEIYSDGANSDSDGLTELSFIRIINDGHADGIADVDDDAVVFSLQGFTDGTGNVFKASAPTTLGASLRVKVGTTIYYLPLYTTQ